MLLLFFTAATRVLGIVRQFPKRRRKSLPCADSKLPFTTHPELKSHTPLHVLTSSTIPYRSLPFNTRSMSTMTMMEHFDAQMLDYPGDSDIAMFATPGASGEVWMPVEAMMDDASLTNNFDTTSHHSETVEVDMEQNEEDITEYEMADDVVGIPIRGDGDEELPDAEILYDSAMPLPVTEPVDGILTIPSVEFEHPSPLIVAESFSESPQVTNLHVHTVEHAIDSLPLPSTQENILAASEYDVDSEPGPQEVTHALLAPSAAQTVHEALPDLELASILPTDVPQGDSFALITTSRPENPVPSEIDSTISRERSLPHVPDASQTCLEATAVTKVKEPLQSTENSILVETVIHDALPEEQAEHTSSGDPHEISEGVYIDPPPAVLLSLSSSAVQHEYSLFNQPTPSSRSRTPNPGALSDEHQPLHLLLHQRPTLYYEPLRTVFEALRQEEAIYNVPELVEGELVMDAYDLQLAIPEVSLSSPMLVHHPHSCFSFQDNAHTHEVTLHELNVIHDGSDLQGPLRLRLYATSPRFYTRYTALREQIAGLHLVEDDDDGFDDQPVEEHGTGELHDSQCEFLSYLHSPLAHRLSLPVVSTDGPEVAVHEIVQREAVSSVSDHSDYVDDPHVAIVEPEQVPDNESTTHQNTPTPQDSGLTLGETEYSVAGTGTADEVEENGEPTTHPTELRESVDTQKPLDHEHVESQVAFPAEDEPEIEEVVEEGLSYVTAAEWPEEDDTGEEQVIDLTAPDTNDPYVEEISEDIEAHTSTSTERTLSTQAESAGDAPILEDEDEGSNGEFFCSHFTSTNTFFYRIRGHS